MTLTLSIRNVERLAKGMSATFAFHGHDGAIGRAPTCDWCLPDPTNFISSRHCEVRYRDGDYVLVDVSTNGTYLNGDDARMPREYQLRQGDLLQIGDFEILVELTDRGARSEPEAEQPTAWGGGARPGRSEGQTGTGDGQSPATDWNLPPPSPPDRPRRSPDEIWRSIVVENAVDWSRGGFGTERPTAPDPSQLTDPPELSQTGASRRPGRRGSKMTADQLVDAFLSELGVDRSDVPNPSPSTLLAAARVLKRLVAGVVLMVEARAKAKAQLGAEATGFKLDGNNPIKFARTTEQAAAHLISPPLRSFMEGERAVEEAFYDLQSHQIAMLKAMQAALRETLARFSPTEIQQRAERSGFLSRIMPSARDAALWQVYQREFSGVALGSDEAFMDVFAAEFRKAYDDQARASRPG